MVLPTALAHAPDPSRGLVGFLPLILPLAVGALIAVIAARLLDGPLGRGNARRFGTVVALLAIGVAVLVGVDRLLAH